MKQGEIALRESKITELVEDICPICGKLYIPAPLHIYRVSNGRGGQKRVCKWSCVMEGERRLKNKQKVFTY